MTISFVSEYPSVFQQTLIHFRIFLRIEDAHMTKCSFPPGAQKLIEVQKVVAVGKGDFIV